VKQTSLLACAAFLSVTPAFASGVDDGNRGLQALNQGEYDQAISLFNHAIKYGRLSDEDKEFAYANLGRAYYKKGDNWSAIVNLDTARQLKPDDTDAQNDLLAVLQQEMPADSIPNRPKESFWHSLGQALLQGALDGIKNGLQQNNQQ
jgi:tetratricopeptide (TPR) repeat protein